MSGFQSENRSQISLAMKTYLASVRHDDRQSRLDRLSVFILDRTKRRWIQWHLPKQQYPNQTLHRVCHLHH